jgi:hypothetical protein
VSRCVCSSDVERDRHRLESASHRTLIQQPTISASALFLFWGAPGTRGRSASRAALIAASAETRSSPLSLITWAVHLVVDEVGKKLAGDPATGGLSVEGSRLGCRDGGAAGTPPGCRWRSFGDRAHSSRDLDISGEGASKIEATVALLLIIPPILGYVLVRPSEHVLIGGGLAGVRRLVIAAGIGRSARQRRSFSPAGETPTSCA